MSRYDPPESTEAPDMPPARPLSMPPKNWLTFRLVLIGALVFIDVLGLLGAALGAVTKDSLSNLLSGSVGGILGTLTGGGSSKR